MAMSGLKLVTFKLSQQTLSQFEDLKTILRKKTPMFGLLDGPITRTDVLRHIVSVQHDIYVADLESERASEQKVADAEVKKSVKEQAKKLPVKRIAKKTKGKKS